MQRKTFGIVGIGLVSIGCWLALAGAAQGRVLGRELPVNDTRTKAIVNRAWAPVRGIGPDRVQAERAACAAAQGGLECSNQQIVDRFIDASSNYHAIYRLSGDEWQVGAMSMSTATSFYVTGGRRTCSQPGRGGCPSSGIWSVKGFSISVGSLKAHSR